MLAVRITAENSTITESSRNLSVRTLERLAAALPKPWLILLGNGFDTTAADAAGLIAA